ncbi:Threonine dehydratase biosynthetic, chloroplastic, partial [Cucurbita argyrosperma subsp. sororia]
MASSFPLNVAADGSVATAPEEAKRVSWKDLEVEEGDVVERKSPPANPDTKRQMDLLPSCLYSNGGQSVGQEGGGTAGAYNMISQLPKEKLKKGVICASAGNHAQGVALAGQRLKTEAHIVMPTTTPQIKIDAVEDLGGIVDLFGNDFNQAQERAEERSKEEDLTIIPPFDDEDVIAGQGTIGMEIGRQIRGRIHAIFVPVGGGGLAAGIVSFYKLVYPDVKVFGVEPNDQNSMAQALYRGKVVYVHDIGNFADGVAVKQVGNETFRICNELLDGVILVKKESIASALKAMFNDGRNILEPSGALSIAGAVEYCRRHGIRRENVVAVTSGANMNFDQLGHIADLANSDQSILASWLPECPKSLESLTRVVDRMHFNITEMTYRFSSGSVDALLVYKVRPVKEDLKIETLVAELISCGFKTYTLSDNEVVRNHLNLHFLKGFQPNWNISLLHHRDQGIITSEVLIGIQLEKSEEKKFDEYAKEVGYQYETISPDDSAHVQCPAAAAATASFCAAPVACRMNVLLNAPTSHPLSRKWSLLSPAFLLNGTSIPIDDNRNRIRVNRVPFIQATLSKHTVENLPNSVSNTAVVALEDALVAAPLPPRKRVLADSLQFPPGYLGAVPNRLGSDDEEDSLDAMEYLTRILGSKVYDVAIESPLQLAPMLSERLGVNIWLKREDLQPVFSFKLRGAYNMMAKLPKEQLERGVICSSAGNHAQGVALAARRLRCDAVIAMPVTTPEIKWQSVQKLGATVVLVGDSYDEAQAYAKKRSVDEGRTFIPPFDHPDVIAGQGTVGMEIVRQMKSKLHAIFVPVGGGGLIAGIAAYVKRVSPEVKIIGVEPSDANAMALSLCHGQRIILEKAGGFADGVAVKEVGEETFRLCKGLMDGVVLVGRDAICASIKDMFEEKRSILEPAGALSLAGAEAYCKYYGLKGENVVVITSGANMNFDKLRIVTELANVGREQEAVLVTKLPEKPGSFKRFCELIGAMNITEFKYRYNSEEEAVVLYSVGMHMPSELEEMMNRMISSQLETYNLTNNDLVKDHLRYLMGGRSNVENEVLCRFIFPERPGALEKFLDAFSPRWNISLFHYHGQGETGANIFVGLQIEKPEMGEFHERARRVGYDYVVVTDDGIFQLLMHHRPTHKPLN